LSVAVVQESANNIIANMGSKIFEILLPTSKYTNRQLKKTNTMYMIPNRSPFAFFNCRGAAIQTFPNCHAGFVASPRQGQLVIQARFFI
jgi:hypothetical protein